MEIGVKQAAELLQVSEKTIYRWVTSRRIPFYRVGSQYRFSRTDLLRWAASAGSAVSAVAQDAGTTQEFPPVRLAASLRAGGIFYRVGGRDVRSVLEEVVGMMRLPDGVAVCDVVDRLCEREALATTGLGDGIAYPHCRDIALPGISDPLVALAFLEEAVDFSAIDNRPVRAVFLLLSPSAPQSIRLMSRLAYATRKEEFMKLVQSEAPREALFAAAERVDAELERA